MATREEVVLQSQERATQILALVEELGSVAAAAERLGLSCQRVHKIIGPGAFRMVIEIACQDCGRPARVKRTGSRRCQRCKKYFAKHGHPWSRQAVLDTRRKLRKTYCKHGHPFSEDNLYISPRGHPLCRTCQAERDRRYREKKARRAAKTPDLPEI